METIANEYELDSEVYLNKLTEEHNGIATFYVAFKYNENVVLILANSGLSENDTLFLTAYEYKEFSTEVLNLVLEDVKSMLQEDVGIQFKERI